MNNEPLFLSAQSKPNGVKRGKTSSATVTQFIQTNIINCSRDAAAAAAAAADDEYDNVDDDDNDDDGVPHLLRSASQPETANRAPPAPDVDLCQAYYRLSSLFLLCLQHTLSDKRLPAEISPNIMWSLWDGQAHFPANYAMRKASDLSDVLQRKMLRRRKKKKNNSLREVQSIFRPGTSLWLSWFVNSPCRKIWIAGFSKNEKKMLLISMRYMLVFIHFSSSN